MAGRNVAFVNTIAGRCALSVNDAHMPTPKGWTWAPLSDVARLESGHTPSRSHPEYWDGDIAWIGIKDAREHHARVINDTSQHVTRAGIDNSAARMLPAGTVCLSRTASVGYVVVMGRPMATSQDFVNWVCSPSLVPDYLKWVLLAEGGEGLRKFGKGTTHTTIYFPEVEAFHIALAPVNEQRRIVAKLDAVFAQTRAAKARLERLPALFEKLKRSILAAAFRGDLTKDWRAAHSDVEPASVLLDRIRAERRRRWEDALRAKGKDPTKTTYEEPGPVDVAGLAEPPLGWSWASLASISDIQSGVTKGQKRKTDDVLRQVPYLRVANVQRGYLNLDEVLEIDATPREIDDLALQPGDILLNEGGDRDKLGRGWVWEGQIPMCIHQNHVFRARLYDRGIEPRLVSTYGNAFGQAWFVDEGKQTTNLASISKTKLSRFPVPIPPAAEQVVLAERVFAVLAQIEQLASRVNTMLQHLARCERDALAKAFRGELVQRDPADECASVLLDRIRAARATEPDRPRRGQGQRADDSTVAAAPTSSNGLATNGHHHESLDLVAGALQSDRRLTMTAISETTGLDRAAVKKALKILVDGGQVRVDGKARSATYVWTA